MLTLKNLAGEVVIERETLEEIISDAPSLVRADFSRWDLTGADFSGLDLTDADFSRATVRNADFSDATVRGADFSRASGVGSATWDGASGMRRACWGDTGYAWCGGCDSLCSADCMYECGECEGCCLHSSCEGCGDHAECDGEGYCEDCVRNRNDVRVRPVRCGPRYVDHGTRAVGVEWEFNDELGSRAGELNEWADRWGAGLHTDGSCGYEAVTPPLGGEHVARCVRALGAALVDAGAACDDRCGIHVHVDASDMGWHEMRRFCLVYAKIEPLLFLLGGQQRARNYYCLPCGRRLGRAAADEEDFVGEILAEIYRCSDREFSARAAREKQRGKPSKKDAGRYKAVNLVPWASGRVRGTKDRTIEFRLHRNSLNVARVLGWVQLCERIVSWCARASESDVRALPDGALRALIAIAPESKAWILGRIGAWREAIRPRRRKVCVVGGWRLEV